MELFPPIDESKPPEPPAPPASKLIFDDLPYWRPQGEPRHHIYQGYFTPGERRRLKAIPEKDLTSEIQLLRVLLARCFAQVPRFPHDSKRAALPIKFQIQLVTVFSRAAIVIGSMISLHKKMHNPADEWGRDVLQALREMNPYEDLG
jgi:hypothetical protein